jgi:5'-nucleotidase
MNNRPLILVTNDDGITAKGIKALVEVASEFGEVVVVAPDSPQSGKGHAITLHSPLWLHKSNIFENIESYECSGTPVDCVKLAKHEVLKGRTVDLCVSGINHGSNASLNILYSGTMSAAMEASLEGIDSIGFSLMDFSYDANFEPSKKFIRHIIKEVLENGLQNTKLINVNIPNLPESEIKGIKICKQADGQWVEDFKTNIDPFGRKYYWMTGEFLNHDKSDNSDILALSEGYISIVPSAHDLTDYPALDKLKGLEI